MWTKSQQTNHKKTGQEIRFDNFNRTEFIKFFVKIEQLDACGKFKLTDNDYSHELCIFSTVDSTACHLNRTSGN